VQGRENGPGSLIDRKCMDLLYPDTDGKGCGYSSETGGKMAQIRDSLNNDKIKRYHSEYYRPDNACLIITGTVDAGDVLAGLDGFEKKWLETHPTNEMAGKIGRPWTTAVSPLPATKSETIDFPSEDESTGTISVCWRAAETAFAAKHAMSALARKLLWSYMTTSAGE